MKLNTYCAHLVPLLGVEMSELMEVQRALKEQSPHFDDGGELNPLKGANMYQHQDEPLPAKPGPGGGVELDPFRAAFFLLAAVLNGPRKQASYSTWMTWHLNHEGSVLSGYGDDWKPTFTKCELTGKHLFGDALKQIISDISLANRVRQVRVSSNLVGEIVFDDGKVSRFEKAHRHSDPGLYRLSVLSGRVLQNSAVTLKFDGGTGEAKED